MPQGLNIFQRTNRDFDYRRVSMIVNYDVKNKEKKLENLIIFHLKNGFSQGKKIFFEFKVSNRNFKVKRSVMLRCN